MCAQDEDGDGEPDCALSSHILDYECDVGVFFDNGHGADFVLIEGEDLIDPGKGNGSRYTLKNPFYIMTTEVTQGMFEGLMGYNPSTYVGAYKPAGHLSWHEAAAFANAMSVRQEVEECYVCEGVDSSVECEEAMDPNRCEGYRLPTESEWKLAARSGTTSDFWTGAGAALGGTYSNDSCSTGILIEDGALEPVLSEYAWFCGTDGLNGFDEGTKEVGQLLPNGFGLYDMIGNLSEWTTDWDKCHLRGGWCAYPEVGLRVIEGGHYDANPSSLSRLTQQPYVLDERYGFRLVAPLLEDKDEDGVIDVKDCDDTDPLSLSYEQDRDCDKVLSVEDCDDENPYTGDLSLDADCDGLLTYNDCDDSDPSSLSDFLDKNCDGTREIEVFSAGGEHSCGIDVDGV